MCNPLLGFVLKRTQLTPLSNNKAWGILTIRLSPLDRGEASKTKKTLIISQTSKTEVLQMPSAIEVYKGNLELEND